jgi:electron transfer flavoprotein alpha subunit
MTDTMIKTGVLVEIENDEVKDNSLGVMTAAAGQEIHALVMGSDASKVKDKLAEYGAVKVVNITASGDLAASPDFQAQVLVEAVKEYELENLLGTASVTGLDLFARIAVILDEPLLSDCVAVNLGEKSATKSHFSGKTFATLKADAKIFLCTLRSNSVEPAASQAAGELVEFSAKAEDPGLIKIVETKKTDTDHVDLTEASIVISGGRAIKDAKNFAMLEDCARKIGAGIGASRAAVDAGYAPHTIQVGQTGKTVSPRLYIACGISGAVQHFAGMKTSRVIVAINEDKDAPIFSKCDYGIVGDIFDVVPALTEKL